MADPRAVTVVIPAMNEAAAIGGVVRELLAVAPWRDVLVIDDGSTDDTATRASEAGASVIRHPYNKGNGAAVKSGIRSAESEYILIVDGDGQHQPADALRLVARLGEYDLVIGARSGQTQAGALRRMGNAALNGLASYLTDRPIPDLTSGFRGANRARLLEFIHLLPNGFSTPTTTTMCFLRAGYNVGFEPVEARQRVGASKIRLSRDGPKFLLIMLRVMTIFSPLRVFLPLSAASFVAGAAYATWTIITRHDVTDSSVLLIVLAVIVFLFGLVSEQIAALRADDRR
jgi:glycosyltransferase involved in cell wall biosynthesis